MALSQSTIVSSVKDKIYNTGLGEKPSIRQATGTATVSGGTVTFSVAAGQGAAHRAGHVLSSYNSTDATDAYGFYILSIATDSITAVNGYEGAAIANAASMPALLEHQAPITEYRIHNAIDEIVAGYLFPEVFDVFNGTFTPNLATLQSNGDAGIEEVLRAWQYIGPTLYQVPLRIEPFMPTSEFASGKMLSYDVMTGTIVHYSASRRVSLADSSGTALEALIAKGAAALVVEGTETSSEWETSKNDARERSQRNPSRPLWQSFYQAKRQYAEDFSRDVVRQWKVDRG